MLDMKYTTRFVCLISYVNAVGLSSQEQGMQPAAASAESPEALNVTTSIPAITTTVVLPAHISVYTTTAVSSS